MVHRFLLGSVAFGVSFVLGLLINRNFKQALLTGVITVPASYAGAVVVKQRQIHQEIPFAESLSYQVQELETQKSQLHLSLSVANTTIQQLEASIDSLQAERGQLLSRVSELHNQREVINQELINLYNEKQETAGELSNLQAEIQAFERYQHELSQTLSQSIAEVEKAENYKTYLQTELNQMQAQVKEQQKNREVLESESTKLNGQKKQTAKTSKKLPVQLKKVTKTLLSSPSLPPEWQQLMAQLQEHDLRILQAIVEQNNPAATLKNIAEENITMPELLINSINERALDTIGDLLIEPGADPPVIAEAEYLTKIKQIIKIHQQRA